jgi:hypothetical protein
MGERGNPPPCPLCGENMERVYSSFTFTFAPSHGRTKILDTLNNERPGARSKRSQEAVARGLNYTRPTVGRGYG